MSGMTFFAERWDVQWRNGGLLAGPDASFSPL